MGGNQQGQIPTDVYLSFVRSLYGNRMTLRAGMISHVTTCALIFFKVQDPVYLAFGGIIFALWIIRAASMRRFDSVEFTDHDRDLIKKWEWRYIAGSGLVTLMLGLMNCYAFLVSHDTFAQLAALSVTIGTMVSVVGRNFGSKTNVDIISLAACLPIMIGMFLAGSIYTAILGVLVIPLIVTTRAMANGVREFLYENVLSRREIALIADRFNAALNNMPHGLFMLDENSRIVVANRKAAELLSVGDREMLSNHRLDAVLR